MQNINLQDKEQRLNPIALHSSNIAILATGLMGLLANFSLFADGSNVLLQIAHSKSFFIPEIEWNRSLAYFITQLPVVLGVLGGVKALGILSYSYSFTTILIPAILLVLGNQILWRSFRISWQAPIVAIAFGAGLLISISTSIFGSSVIYLLIACLLARTGTSNSKDYSLGFLIALCGIIGDSLLLLSPIIFLAIWVKIPLHGETQIRWRPKTFPRIIQTACLSIALSINLTNLSGRNEGVGLDRATNSAVSLPFLIQNFQFMFLAISVTLFFLSRLIFKPAFRKAMYLFTLFLLTVTLFSGFPGGHEIFYSRYALGLGLYLATGLIAAELWSQKRHNQNSSHATRGRTSDIFFFVLVIVTLWMQFQISSTFTSFTRSVYQIVNSSDTTVIGYEVAAPAILGSQFSWDYTMPSISRVLCDSKSCSYIENQNPDLWQPFFPSEGAPLSNDYKWMQAILK